MKQLHITSKVNPDAIIDIEADVSAALSEYFLRSKPWLNIRLSRLIPLTSVLLSVLLLYWNPSKYAYLLNFGCIAFFVISTLQFWRNNAKQEQGRIHSFLLNWLSQKVAGYMLKMAKRATHHFVEYAFCDNMLTCRHTALGQKSFGWTHSLKGFYLNGDGYTLIFKKQTAMLPYVIVLHEHIDQVLPYLESLGLKKSVFAKVEKSVSYIPKEDSSPPLVLRHLRYLALTNIRRLNGDRAYKDNPQHNKQSGKPLRQIYKLAAINLFIGKNGSGKSTVLDMIDCVRDSGMLGTMPRENMTDPMHAHFLLIGGSFMLKLVFPSRASPINRTRYGVSEYQETLIESFIEGEQFLIDEHFNKFSHDNRPLVQAIIKKLPVQIWHSSQLNDIAKLDERHVNELNKIAHLLKGTFGADKEEREFFIKREGANDDSDMERFYHLKQKPIRLLNDGEGITYFSGDDGDQWQNVPLQRIPSGWLAYAKIAAWLNSDEIKNRAICLIDEPEVHLHPSLQRELIKRINDIAIEKELQIFIASHSPIFINMAISQSNIKLFSVDSRNQLEEITVPDVILKNLDVKGSDILQANGVIWVEGESEKIYLRHWIAKILEMRNIDFILDFEICEYGGANLSHFGYKSDLQFTQIQRMNRNLIVLLDRDNDFIFSSDGVPILTNNSSYKARIWKELTPTGRVIVTDAYTIEGYLPQEFFKKYFFYDSGGKMGKKKQYSKVDIAKDFQKQNYDLKSHQHSALLIAKLNQIVDILIDWNI